MLEVNGFQNDHGLKLLQYSEIVSVKMIVGTL